MLLNNTNNQLVSQNHVVLAEIYKTNEESAEPTKWLVIY